VKELEKRLATLEAARPKDAEGVPWTQEEIRAAIAFDMHGTVGPVPVNPEILAIARKLDELV
jgi:hypothetical protein